MCLCHVSMQSLVNKGFSDQVCLFSARCARDCRTGSCAVCVCSPVANENELDNRVHIREVLYDALLNMSKTVQDPTSDEVHTSLLAAASLTCAFAQRIRYLSPLFIRY